MSNHKGDNFTKKIVMASQETLDKNLVIENPVTNVKGFKESEIDSDSRDITGITFISQFLPCFEL